MAKKKPGKAKNKPKSIAYGVKPTQVRLTDADKAKIQDIRAIENLPTIAGAIRAALDSFHSIVTSKDKTQ